MSAITDAEEVALARKLAETLHLNVEERARLSPRGVRLSAVVAAVREVIEARQCFPPGLAPGAQYDGVVIELRTDGSLWTHERREVGLGRLSPVRSERVSTLEAAVTRYLRVANGGADGIDGVAVDWRA